MHGESNNCIYTLDDADRIIPNGNGEHLADCERHVCGSTHYKCPGFYCIPWQYVCNHRVDCPGGSEERNCNERSCLPMQMKCRQSTTCIAMHSICDGVADCQFQDDEYFCEMFHTPCPKNCTCLLFVIVCTNWDRDGTSFQISSSVLPYLKISITLNGHLSRVVPFLNQFNHPIELRLEKAGISDICTDLKMYLWKYFVRTLAFPNNNLTIITSECFVEMPFLFFLNLSHNYIVALEKSSFVYVRNLSIVDLSFNRIIQLVHPAFLGRITLKLLNLQGNLITEVSTYFFFGMKVTTILVENYKVCCIKPSAETICQAVPVWPNSCGSLIDSRTSKIMIWMVGIFGLTLNVILLFPIQKRTKARDGSYIQTVQNIAVGDTLLCLYLISIAISDAIFQGRYFEYEKYWRGSLSCFSSCILFLDASLISVFSMHLMTVSRYSIVKYPLDSKFREKQFIMNVIICSYIITVGLAVSFVSLYRIFSVDKLMPTGLCLLIGNIDVSAIPTLVTWLNIYSQGVPIITIPLLNCLLIYEKNKFDKKSKDLIASGKRKSLHGIVFRLVVASISNLLCWVASTFLLLLTVILPNYPYEILVLTVIIAFPLNSLINPFVLILSQEIAKYFKRFAGCNLKFSNILSTTNNIKSNIMDTSVTLRKHIR